MFDEIYFHKDAQNRVESEAIVESEENSFKGVMAFTIKSLEQSIPLVIRAVPVVKIEGL